MPIPHPRPVRLVLAAILGAGLAIGPLSAPAAHAADPVTINLLNINDFHGRIAKDTTVQFAGTIEKSRAQYGDANTLLLSAGDNIGASLFASATQDDQPTIDVLNALDLAASAVGNHEFDQGFADLTDRVIDGGANAKWDYLGANVYTTGTTTPVLPGYGLYTVGGVTVGVIGAVTQETPSLVSSLGIKGLTFGDPVEAVNRVAAQLTDGNAANGEAQVLVAEYHEGAPDSASATIDLNTELGKSTVFAHIVEDTSAKVSVIFTGHTHQTYAWDAPVTGGGTRPVVQTGSYATNVGQVLLSVDPGTGEVLSHTQSLIPRSTDAAAGLASTYPRAQAVQDVVTAALAYADTVGNKKIGRLKADVTTAFSGGSYVNGKYAGGTRDDRSKESAMGNLVADALLKTLKPAASGGAQIALVNPGGLRAELLYTPGATETRKKGVITYAMANSVLPFVNNLWTTTLTGAQLKAVLEQQWQPTGSTRPYLQLGMSKNVRYTYDASADAGSRITGIWVNGTRVTDAGTYRVGSFSFLLAGGDNFTTFAAGTDTKDSGLVDYQAWIAYLTKTSPVTPSFDKHAVQVQAASTAAVGDEYPISLSGLDLTSLGAPANTKLTVKVGGKTVARNVPVTDGAAAFDVTLPNTGKVVVTAKPSGTVVRIPVTIEKAEPKVYGLAESRTVKKGTPVKFRVQTAPLGTGVWVTGTVKVYVGDRVVARTTLRPGNYGTKSITIPKSALKRYGRSTVVATAKLVTSPVAQPTDLKVLTLTIA
ncbi:MAG: 5'-nucleotidase C-terminal domain-containing protein [Propionicimonas sp.]|uniref:bifunctional metallophosphatase/5'-nucleotidase n=1 Tax=Propionicimonas sp. TaxID=1955623 RepID=UPI003D0BEFBD